MTNLEVPVHRAVKIGSDDYIASMVPHPNLPPCFTLRKKRHKHEDSLPMRSLLGSVTVAKPKPRKGLSAEEIRSKISEQDIPAETKLILQSIVDDIFAIEDEALGFGQLKYCPICHQVSRANKFVGYKCPECHQKYPDK